MICTCEGCSKIFYESHQKAVMTFLGKFWENKLFHVRVPTSLEEMEVGNYTKLCSLCQSQQVSSGNRRGNHQKAAMLTWKHHIFSFHCDERSSQYSTGGVHKVKEAKEEPIQRAIIMKESKEDNGGKRKQI